MAMINQETKVGLFVLSGLAILAVFIILLEGISLEKGYTVNVLFANSVGLPEKGAVKIAGVEVGKVKNIELVNGRALVVVFLKPKIRIHRDTQARIVSVGMVGNKYMELTKGSEEEPLLQNGDTIEGVNPEGLDDLVGIAKEGLDGLVDTLKSFEKGGSLEKSFARVLDNLVQITDKLNAALGKDGRDLKETVENLNGVSESLKSISAKLEKGQGAAGKLLSDRKTEEQVQNIITSLEKTSKKLQKRFRAD